MRAPAWWNSAALDERKADPVKEETVDLIKGIALLIVVAIVAGFLFGALRTLLDWLY